MIGFGNCNIAFEIEVRCEDIVIVPLYKGKEDGKDGSEIFRRQERMDIACPLVCR